MREGACWQVDTLTRVANGRPGGSVDQKAAAIQVTGDGHGHREFRNRTFGHRELANGFRRLKAKGLTPERLTTVAVTRHLE